MSAKQVDRWPRNTRQSTRHPNLRTTGSASKQFSSSCRGRATRWRTTRSRLSRQSCKISSHSRPVNLQWCHQNIRIAPQATAKRRTKAMSTRNHRSFNSNTCSRCLSTSCPLSSPGSYSSYPRLMTWLRPMPCSKPSKLFSTFSSSIRHSLITIDKWCRRQPNKLSSASWLPTSWCSCRLSRIKPSNSKSSCSSKQWPCKKTNCRLLGKRNSLSWTNCTRVKTTFRV